MKTINVLQGSQEWLDLRANHFTASEAPAMMNDSKYMSRDQLLKMKFTGEVKEVSSFQQKIFDEGHATEEMARPIIEEMIEEDLYPVTGILEDSKLLASFDGLTLLEDAVFEHKLFNATLAENVRNQILEPHYYWQLEQQLLVSGAERAIFVTSDGTNENLEYMWYESHPQRRKDLIAGWAQFDNDLAGYEVKAKKEIVVGAQNHLPVITYHVTGTEISTNIGICLEDIKEMAQVEMSKTLETDQDFADKDRLNKDVKKARAALKESISKVRGEFVSYSQFEEIAQDMDVVLQKMQSHGEKQVKLAKDAKKKAIKVNGENAVTEYAKECDLKIKPMSLSAIAGFFMPDFDLAMKNKRTIESLENAVSEVVANLKIEINQAMDRIEPNLQYLRDNAGDYKFLFSDSQQLVNQEAEPFQAIIKSRIADHKKAEEERLEEERKRIQAEEEAKAQREAEALAEAERERIRKEEQTKAQAEAAELAKTQESPKTKPKQQAIKRMNNEGSQGNSNPSLTLGDTMASAAPTLASATPRALTVREFLTEYCKSKGWGVDEGDLIESLTEGKRVYSDSYMDEHRWYICQEVVNEIDGTFIMFTDYIITGDNSMGDMDLSYDLDSAKIVTRKERQIIEVYYE